jgi:hypothetical protein
MSNFNNFSNLHRYSLEKGSKKHICPDPDCTQKRFVRYIDTETGEYLPDHFGRCDRESKCGYFLNPYTDGYARAIWEQEQGNKTNWKPTRPSYKKKPVNKPKRAYIPNEVLIQTRAGYEQNIFIQNLLSSVPFPFEVQDIEQVISLYHLGTVQNGYRAGAITFPFIDVNHNVRALQVKQFNEHNHTIGTDFLHSIIEKHHIRNNTPVPNWLTPYNGNETKVSCLFGEHLLSIYPQNPIALVEAPKTAIYGTLYFGPPKQPKNLIWLAVYNLSSLNYEKCKALKGRDVYLFPDLSKDGKTFELWSNKSAEIQKRLQGTSFRVSNLLEQLAPENDRNQGKDIADYLIKQDWRLFRKQNIQEQPPQPELEKVTKVTKVTPQQNILFSHAEPLLKVEIFKAERINQTIKEQPTNWSDEIAELENYFRIIKLPTEPFKLNNGSTINNCQLFIESHLAIVKANNGERSFLPYLNRLREFVRLQQ